MATIARGKAGGRTANRAARLARTAAECRWPTVQASRRIPYTTTFLCYIDDLTDAGETAATEAETIVFARTAANVGSFLRGMVEARVPGFAWPTGEPTPEYPEIVPLVPVALYIARRGAGVGASLAAFIESMLESDRSGVQHLLDGLVEKGLADL